jgi:hypothetical protein
MFPIILISVLYVTVTFGSTDVHSLHKPPITSKESFRGPVQVADEALPEFTRREIEEMILAITGLTYDEYMSHNKTVEEHDVVPMDEIDEMIPPEGLHGFTEEEISEMIRGYTGLSLKEYQAKTRENLAR